MGQTGAQRARFGGLMPESDRQFLLGKLQQGRTALLDAVAGVTDGQAALRPAPEKWSILNCVEHVAAAEAFLPRGIMQATPIEPSEPSEMGQSWPMEQTGPASSRLRKARGQRDDSRRWERRSPDSRAPATAPCVMSRAMTATCARAPCSTRFAAASPATGAFCCW